MIEGSTAAKIPAPLLSEAEAKADQIIAERVVVRRARALPILADLRTFLDATMEKVSGKSSVSAI